MMSSPNFQSVLLCDKRRKVNFVRFICTINLVFTLMGYSLMTGALAVFIPEYMFDSSVITWPLRGGFLAIACLAFLVGNSRNAKFDAPMWLFVVFSILYVIRAVIDLCLKDPGSFSPDFAWKFSEYNPNFYFQTWSYIFLFTLFPLLSVYRSWEQIDFERALDFFLILGSLACFSSLKSLVEKGGDLFGVGADSRVSSSLILNSIAFGHIGVSVALLSIFRFIHSSRFSIWKIACSVILPLAMITMFRAGSRGPFVAFTAVLFVYLSTMFGKNFLIAGIFLFALGAFAFIFAGEAIISIISKVSPILATRLESTFLYGEASGREYIYLEYLREAFNHPIFGFQLDALGYSHNVFIDSFMMFGLFVGWIVPALLFIAFFRAVKLLSRKFQMSWISLIFLQAFFAVQFSGTIGGNSMLQGSLFLIFLFFMKFKGEIYMVGNTISNRLSS